MFKWDKLPQERRRSERGNKQFGFTVVELMVASVVFSVILLLVAGVIVRFTNQFQKGVVESSTQTVARNIVDTVAQSVQNGSGAEPQGTSAYCIGGTKYTFNKGHKLVAGSFALKEEKGMGSDCSRTPSPGFQELLSDNMRLSSFSVDRVPNTTNLWTVTVTVAYGDDDLLENPNSASPTCIPGSGASHFCAVRTLSTTVKQWL